MGNGLSLVRVEILPAREIDRSPSGALVPAGQAQLGVAFLADNGEGRIVCLQSLRTIEVDADFEEGLSLGLGEAKALKSPEALSHRKGTLAFEVGNDGCVLNKSLFNVARRSSAWFKDHAGKEVEPTHKSVHDFLTTYGWWSSRDCERDILEISRALLRGENPGTVLEELSLEAADALCERAKVVTEVGGEPILRARGDYEVLARAKYARPFARKSGEGLVYPAPLMEVGATGVLHMDVEAELNGGALHTNFWDSYQKFIVGSGRAGKLFDSPLHDKVVEA